MEEQLPSAAVTLHVLPESLHLFTTVLQSGIKIKTGATTDMCTFMCQIPGFTADYISSTVETIFLNGTPVDDITQPFTGNAPVLALSAAMPGLAGAIFRKNSIHSTLRTQTTSQAPLTDSTKAITVTLKLFNSIAKECGPFLLETGITIKASKVLTFLRPGTGLCDNITDIELNNEVVNVATLQGNLSRFQYIYLKVKDSHG